MGGALQLKNQLPYQSYNVVSCIHFLKIIYYSYKTHITMHNAPAWGHRKIIDLAEILPNEYLEPIKERPRKIFPKYELRKIFLMVKVGWSD